MLSHNYLTGSSKKVEVFGKFFRTEQGCLHIPSMSPVLGLGRCMLLFLNCVSGQTDLLSAFPNTWTLCLLQPGVGSILLSELRVSCLAGPLEHLNVQGDVWILESFVLTLPICRLVLPSPISDATGSRPGCISYRRHIVTQNGDIGALQYTCIHKRLEA